MIINNVKNSVNWPVRVPLFGVPVTPTTYSEATDCIVAASHGNVSACIDFMPVHGLMTAVENSQFKKIIHEKFDLVCPDGQPVKWALNHFYKTELQDRVYGPSCMLHTLNRAHEENIPVYFYGSRQEVLDKLKINLLKRYPLLTIAGMQSPPFRELTPFENEQAARTINESGAKILFIGLGCPKQELWAASQKNHIAMPMLCVGAAFDFHAGVMRQAPAWMQRRGLEWAFRLCKEPGRLWKRYFYYNLYFCLYFFKSTFKQKPD
jgi:exopolysaccharide biosynthesis WecB/TagA/CpsF family protein